MSTALVLCGGGMRGAYEAGAVYALKELNVEYDLITGVSIGALNGVLLIQDGCDKLVELWSNMDQSLVLKDELPSMDNFENFIGDADKIIPLLKGYVEKSGANIEPFKKFLKNNYSHEKFNSSNIDFAMIALEVPSRKPLVIKKSDMNKDNAVDLLLATSACFPAFPTLKYENKTYIDGGYYDNLPIELAFNMGATKIIAIDLTPSPTHSEFMNRDNIIYIKPKESLGLMFDFGKGDMTRKMKLGYLDTMKAFGKYQGFTYTFSNQANYKFPGKYYNQLLRQDHRCKKLWKITDEFLVYNKLCKINEVEKMNSDEINIAILEVLMKQRELKTDKLYDILSEVRMIIDFFSDVYNEEYDLMPGNPKEIIDSLKKISRIELIKKILHQEIFPKKKIIPSNIVEKMFSVEYACAKWIIGMKKEISK
ncbi:MAG: patatin-like phospholipase family protein [Anaerorhabdus sp.]